MGPRGREQAAPLSTRSRSRQRRARRLVPIRVKDPIRVLASMVAFSAAVVLAWTDMTLTPTIGAVDVAGARHVRVTQAIARSELLETPTFRASAADARAKLRSLPAVRDATVEIALPDRARITLVEREAAGRWAASNGIEWFVDTDGVLFPSADPNAAPALRVSDERPATNAGARLDPALVQVALRLAAIAPGELRADATSPRVVMTAGANGLVLRFASWEIRFGGPESFDDKLALAKRYLRDNPTRRLDYVDVRNADRIVVSPQ